MAKLKLDDWAHLSEIAASTVVVVSLIYVALEINQNTTELQNASHLAVNQLLAESDMAAALDEEFHHILSTAITTPSGVSEEEFSRFATFITPRIGIWEYMYLAKKDNAVGNTTWIAFSPYFRSLICTDGYRRVWRENEHVFADSFRLHLNNSVIPEECGGSSLDSP